MGMLWPVCLSVHVAGRGLAVARGRVCEAWGGLLRPRSPLWPLCPPGGSRSPPGSVVPGGARSVPPVRRGAVGEGMERLFPWWEALGYPQPGSARFGRSRWILGEVKLETFFCTVSRKQGYIFRGASVPRRLTSGALRDLSAAGVAAENGSF